MFSINFKINRGEGESVLNKVWGAPTYLFIMLNISCKSPTSDLKVILVINGQNEYLLKGNRKLVCLSVLQRIWLIAGLIWFFFSVTLLKGANKFDN